MNRSLSGATLVHAIGSRSGSRESELVVNAAAVVFMTLLTAFAAQVSFSIPFTTIPFTMQPMVVLMSGLALGPRLGMASQLLYLAAGIAGLPVFAVSATLPMGAARLLGPSGGYLLSYPFAAFITGWLAARGFDRRYFLSLLAMATGLAVIDVCGVAWLSLFELSSGARAPLGLQAALAAGFYPFIALDVLKIAFAAGVVPSLRRVLG
jgi:biotin transport system substrate-specific component